MKTYHTADCTEYAQSSLNNIKFKKKTTLFEKGYIFIYFTVRLLDCRITACDVFVHQRRLAAFLASQNALREEGGKYFTTKLIQGQQSCTFSVQCVKYTCVLNESTFKAHFQFLCWIYCGSFLYHVCHWICRFYCFLHARFKKYRDLVCSFRLIYSSVTQPYPVTVHPPWFTYEKLMRDYKLWLHTYDLIMTMALSTEQVL